MSEVQGVAPPDTAPERVTPNPLPQTPSPPPLPSAETLRRWAPLYLSKTDATISRLSQILSTPSGTDNLLLTICYTSLLTSSVLSSISLARIHRTARLIVEKAISLPPNTTVVISTANSTITPSRLLILSARLKALSALISDFRIFIRLWGLLGIWSWGKSVIQKPPEDVILRGVESMQVVANFLYQYLENYAYLSGKGVLGWSKEKQNKAWAWSSRFWALHVGLDFIRLWREARIRRLRAEGKNGVVDAEDTTWRAQWRRQMVVNLAYAPLTVHWSLEQGLVSEFWVGLLGSTVGITRIRELWRRTGSS